MEKSFSALTRQELSRLKFGSNKQILAEGASILFSIGSIKLSIGGISVEAISESEEVAIRLCSIIGRLYGCTPEIKMIEKSQPKRHKAYSVEISPKSQEGKLLFDSGFLEGSTEDYSFGEIKKELFEGEGCLEAATRGAFLGCGVLCDPEKTYRLELVLSSESLTSILFEKLSGVGFGVKLQSRNEKSILYVKQIEAISEMLIFIGAPNVMLEVENIHVYKDVKNNLNRGNNCFIANTGKTIDASQRQLEDIEYLQNNGIVLTDALFEAAQLRINNPESSLKELSEISGTVSKSALNKRFIKIHGLREENENK